ncbi:hypothetical protein RvY_15568 [Ramazzottius varieornatus]|uniref:Uncharacterized protein n=1 Tax=Ramazzottius varieornatus TaxID=947166 RepID=A0A1D1VVD0_RAMVA|nr:hypothetical protein RvY_15568 [Ramazzottius varieornatus]
MVLVTLANCSLHHVFDNQHRTIGISTTSAAEYCDHISSYNTSSRRVNNAKGLHRARSPLVGFPNSSAALASPSTCCILTVGLHTYPDHTHPGLPVATFVNELSIFIQTVFLFNPIPERRAA